MSLSYGRISRSLLALCLLISLSGCLKWFSGRVSEGVARLSIRNVAILTKLVNEDANCGFASDSVINNPVTQGQIGTVGEAVWQVEDCLLEFSDYTTEPDCSGVTQTINGKAKVSARRVIQGRLTGDPAEAAIPTDSEALQIFLDAVEFDDFEVTSSDSEASLTILSGQVTAEIQPLLAVSESRSLCAIPTGNVAVKNLRYQDAELFVDSGDRKFDVDVVTSDLHAQVGVSPTRENALWGEVTVWGKHKKIKGLDEGLNPDYDAAKHFDSFLCTEDLAQPLSYHCPVEEVIGTSAARLGVAALGTLAKLANDDESCGFETANATLFTSGMVGDPGGVATYQISPGNACQVTLSENTLLESDCQDNETWAQGSVAISGKRKIEGYLTGAEDEPAAPDSMRAVSVEMQASFNDFTLELRAQDAKVTFRSGSLSGTLKPILARDIETGVCQWPTPRAEIEDVNFLNLDMLIEQEGKTVAFVLNGGPLYAVNGRVGTLENILSGSFLVDNHAVDISEGVELQPDYNATEFEAGFDCADEWEVVVNEADCSLGKLFAENGARLMIKAFGKGFDAVNRNDDCGFESFGSLLPSDISGNYFDIVQARWNVEQCEVSHAQSSLISEDCLGAQTLMSGSVSVTATRQVEGKIAFGMPPIEPQDRQSVDITVHEMILDNFISTEIAAGSSEPGPYLQVHDAVLSGEIHPVTGEAADNPGVYHIKTDVVGMENVRFAKADVSMFAEGKHFNFTLKNGVLNAFNGSYLNAENSLQGQVEVDGQVYSFNMELNPDYDQVSFDAAYVCEENLKEVVPTP